jgi:hypothetical protein
MITLNEYQKLMIKHSSTRLNAGSIRQEMMQTINALGFAKNDEELRDSLGEILRLVAVYAGGKLIALDDVVDKSVKKAQA